MFTFFIVVAGTNQLCSVVSSTRHWFFCYKMSAEEIYKQRKSICHYITAFHIEVIISSCDAAVAKPPFTHSRIIEAGPESAGSRFTPTKRHIRGTFWVCGYTVQEEPRWSYECWPRITTNLLRFTPNPDSATTHTDSRFVAHSAPDSGMCNWGFGMKDSQSQLGYSMCWKETCWSQRSLSIVTMKIAL